MFTLVAEIASQEGRNKSEQENYSNEIPENLTAYKLALWQLLKQIFKRNQLLSLARQELERQIQVAVERDQVLREILNSKSWRLILWLRRTRLFLFPLGRPQTKAAQYLLSIIRGVKR